MINEFINVTYNHKISFASRPLPTIVFDLLVNGIIESVRLELDDVSVWARLDDGFAIVVGVVVVHSEVVDKPLVVVKHKRQHLLFIPANRIVMDNWTMDSANPLMQFQLQSEKAVPKQGSKDMEVLSFFKDHMMPFQTLLTHNQNSIQLNLFVSIPTGNVFFTLCPIQCFGAITC